MFIQIGERRIKISSIQEYCAAGKRQVGYYALEVKISGTWRTFRFDSCDEYKLVLKNLDEILKVKSV